MRPNKFRELLRAGKPTMGTRVMSPWPTVIEVLGQTKQYDYVEFLAEYTPYDLHDLDNLCRAAELADVTPIIKIDQAASEYVAQRAVGSGFQGVLFTDCRCAEDARRYIRMVRPETPEDGGLFGAVPRRFTPRSQFGGPEYVQALRDVVVILMIEKKEAVENLEEILGVPGIDMIQWGPSDYSVSIGKAGRRTDPEIKATERKVIETALRRGVAPRAEVVKPEDAQYYLDLGVRHFNLNVDLWILLQWWTDNGKTLREKLTK
ncbi:MAG: 2,4-dihydroxyhept-2-ene-1,7-dioic acid aldolase [Deltaproteobacteria bacterium]|nr:2,4-dihydroxyhept-2-ene-1,7-dioic acid aldolase [Deltaproteobacteria bacterium]